VNNSESKKPTIGAIQVGFQTNNINMSIKLKQRKGSLPGAFDRFIVYS
jgi:hypothetical protein